MEKDCTKVWENCLTIIKQNVSEDTFKRWFVPITPVSLENAQLTISVPNKFFYDTLEENFVAVLRTAISRELGDKGALMYQVNVPNRDVVNTDAEYSSNYTNVGVKNQMNSTPEDNKDLSKGEYMNPFAIPGIRRQKVDPHVNPEHHFENYIEGKSNQLARSAGLSLVKHFGSSAFNPLIIYGNTGLGKTHLCGAIGNEFLKKKPDLRVLYIQAEEFTNQIVAAIRNQRMESLTAFYLSIDVLIMDDVQFLAGKERTQSAFFHVFNQLHTSKKQIVLTSDRPPMDMNGMDDRLISRFKWGLITDISPPDLETRMAILESKMQKENVVLPKDVSLYICEQVSENVRELEGVGVGLVGRARLLGRALDIDLAREVIASTVKRASNEVTVENIIQMVCESYGVDNDAIRGKTRKRLVVTARQVAMYLAKEYTDTSLKEIGSHFGNRDHSTVIYSCTTVKNLKDTEQSYNDTVTELERKIKLNLR